jgi:hypothetical protein
MTGQANLESLPDELVLDIVQHLNIARDVAHLGSSSRRFHNFVQHHGWRRFVRGGFPSLRIPSNTTTRWDEVAGRLTYLDQCWEKRAFLIHEYSEEKKAKGVGRQQRRAPSNRQSVSFHPVLDARLLSSLDKELVVWGVGEELIARFNPTTGGTSDHEWYKLDGQKSGYSSGFGDVTALSVIERGGSAEILVGRANGDLHLVTASGDQFGNIVQSLASPEEASPGAGRLPRKSPGQIALTWTEWEPEMNLVASCKQSYLTLYDIHDTETENMKPILSYDLSQDSAPGETSLVRSAKFLSGDTIACALGGTREPVRWAQLTPTGPEFFMAAKNQDALDYLASTTEVTTDSRTTVRAIETVGRSHNDSLLLCAWDDGTYRSVDVFINKRIA